MAHMFSLGPDCMKRQFSVYVFVARGGRNTKLYVGKTGDNNEGCNPVISRVGNHLSYSHRISQLRNYIPDVDRRTLTCVFDHFGPYSEDEELRSRALDMINEMERWLREEVSLVARPHSSCELVPAVSAGRSTGMAEQMRRQRHRTDGARRKVMELAREVGRLIRACP
jgi:hypothetical protein